MEFVSIRKSLAWNEADLVIWDLGVLQASNLTSTVKICESVVRLKIERQGRVLALKDTLNHKMLLPEFIKDISYTLFIYNL